MAKKEMDHRTASANRICEYVPSCRVKYNSIVNMPVYYILNNAALYCLFTSTLLYLTNNLWFTWVFIIKCCSISKVNN